MKRHLHIKLLSVLLMLAMMLSIFTVSVSAEEKTAENISKMYSLPTAQIKPQPKNGSGITAGSRLPTLTKVRHPMHRALRTPSQCWAYAALRIRMKP